MSTNAINVDAENVAMNSDAMMSAMPSGLDASPIVCRACGFANPSDAQQCQRDEPRRCRKLLAGNRRTVKTGRYVTRNLPEFAAIDSQMVMDAEQSIGDAGGRTEMTARELSLHVMRASLVADFRKISLSLERHGLFDGLKGNRLRQGWLSQKQSIASTIATIDRQLGGVGRRPKPVVSISDYFAADPATTATAGPVAGPEAE